MTDKSSRSIFVGNIPYEATEEQLRDIFVQAGPIIAFRLVYDRETGKPKGYGFCEYQDAETAQSAIRNLSNVEINGRNLRIGFASGEQTHQAIDSFQGYIQPDTERIHGDPVEPERAPEAISRAVASLPPEQMYELMKQMKVCIQNNPNEARNMLLQNPQLAYALLQAQIIMKIVDPQVAMSLLHRPRDAPVAPIHPPGGPPTGAMNPYAPAPQTMVPQQPVGIPPPQVNPAPIPSNGIAPQQPPPAPAPVAQQAPAAQPAQPPRLVDPRMMRNQSQSGSAPAAAAAPPAPIPAAQPPPVLPQLSAVGGGGAADQERNQLIMQVLSLRPEQIEMLPPDQRQSILLLKEQISKNMGPF